MNIAWLKDTAERVVRTWLQTFLGLVIAGGFDLPGAVDMDVVRKAAVAALAAALSALMSALGSNVGDPGTASLLPRKSRRVKLEEHARTHYDPGANVDWTPVGQGAPHVGVPPVQPQKALGRRPPKNAPSLKFADHISSIPTHPITDLAPNLSWPMDHNDTVGCCVVAGLDHFRQVVYTSLGSAYTPWTDSDLLKMYQTQNPSFKGWNQGGSSADGGMDIQTFLEYLTKQGVILGFAKVDHTNLDEMRAAIYLGLGVVTGEVLTSRNMTEQVWDYHPRDPQEGGHCTVSVGYNPGEQEVSWGALYGLTDAFVQHNIEEAWFVLTQAHVDHAGFRSGFDLASFAAAYTAITGRSFPVPLIVPPVPTPTPTPVVDSVLGALDSVTLGKLTANAQRRHQTVEDDAARIITSYFK